MFIVGWALNRGQTRLVRQTAEDAEERRGKIVFELCIPLRPCGWIKCTNVAWSDLVTLLLLARAKQIGGEHAMKFIINYSFVLLLSRTLWSAFQVELIFRRLPELAMLS